jgi:hypothetical protein
MTIMAIAFPMLFEHFGYAARPSDVKYMPWELNTAKRMVAIEWTRWVHNEVNQRETSA